MVVDESFLSLHHYLKLVIGFCYLRVNKELFWPANGQKFGLGQSFFFIHTPNFAPLVHCSTRIRKSETTSGGCCRVCVRFKVRTGRLNANPCLRYFPPAASSSSYLTIQATSPKAACCRGIGHLPGEHPITRSAGLQGRPIARVGKQRFVLHDDLVGQDLHATLQVVFRLQDCSCRLFALRKVACQSKSQPYRFWSAKVSCNRPSVRPDMPLTSSRVETSGSVWCARVLGFNPASAPVRA